MQHRHFSTFSTGIPKFAVKFSKRLTQVPYEADLQRLRLVSLVCRRINGRDNTAHGLSDFPCNAVFTAPTHYGLRCHAFKIHRDVTPGVASMPSAVE